MDALYLSANKFIYANCVFTIRNNNDFSCYKGKYQMSNILKAFIDKYTYIYIYRYKYR